MHYFFELLNRENLTPEKAKGTIRSWSQAQIKDFVKRASLELPVDKRQAESIFDYVANSELSGASDPCAGINCRLKHAETLARIATLYADRVLIRNPFEKYQHYRTFSPSSKVNLTNDIKLLHFFKPLLDQGIISISSEEIHFCRNCYENFVLGHNNDLQIRVADVRKALHKKYSSDCQFRLVREEDRLYFETDGSPSLMDHSTRMRLRKLPDVLAKCSDVKLKRKVSGSLAAKSGLLDHLIRPILDDLILQNWNSSKYGASYLTNREIDLEILSFINSAAANHRNETLYKSFSHSVPFIQECNLDNLIKLRIEEGESFRVYRDSLSRLLKNTPEGSIKTLKEAFDDEIRPELNRINLTINKSEKTVWKGLTRDVAIGGCFVGIGLSSGILPSNIGEIVAALGGFKYVSKIADDISKLINKSDEVRDNKYYFLWKLQNEVRQLPRA